MTCSVERFSRHAVQTRAFARRGSPAEPTAKPPLLSGRSLLDGIAAEEHACELHPARMLLDDAGPNGTLSKASLIRDRSGRDSNDAVESDLKI